MTVAPADSAAVPVLSVEPSSITMTLETKARIPWTREPMARSSLRHGITTAISSVRRIGCQKLRQGCRPASKFGRELIWGTQRSHDPADECLPHPVMRRCTHWRGRIDGDISARPETAEAVFCGVFCE